MNQRTPPFAPIIIGTMRLGTWGVNMDTQSLERYIDQCLELELYDFDHADIYGDYTEEAHFGEVLKRRSDLKSKVGITTKCGIKMVTSNRPDHRLKSYDSSKEHILESIENSLRDLGVEQIKLLLLHRPDFLMDPHEIAEAFDLLKKQGKVAHFGVSNFTVSQFEMLNSFTPLVNNQIEFSITQLEPLTDGTLDQQLKLGLTPTAWSPFGGGELFTPSEKPDLMSIQQTAQQIAETHHAKMDQVLLAWVAMHPSGIIPIVGSSKIDRIKRALDATKIRLSKEEWYLLLEAARGRKVA